MYGVGVLCLKLSVVFIRLPFLLCNWVVPFLLPLRLRMYVLQCLCVGYCDVVEFCEA